MGAAQLRRTGQVVPAAVRRAGHPPAMGHAACVAAHPRDADVGGMRELSLQKRLGHASPESTRIYTRVSDPVVVAEYQRALGQQVVP